MRLKRLTLTLPAHMRHTAHHDARALGEAVAKALAKGQRADGPIIVQSGPRGSVLANQVTGRMKGGRHGG
ncbi:hypothetical protein [uncultured Litoreibacter sp.]|uniref:hypothetical protein n=1 Tax=uncultured Litoreibacter sp. TaxID=1392394 RepID=UPI002609FBDA|nr:hypothetical protein [uncultured Litoreibacter sp.]